MKRNALGLFWLFISLTTFGQFPSSFDLRDSGRVSSIRSQQGGTCWTHGTMASIESNLLTNGIWTENNETGEPNLAEYHLDWWNGFNQYYNADLDNPYNNNEGLEVHMGGDYLVATAYMSRLTGVVRDIDAQNYDNPPSQSNPSWHYYYPRDVLWFTIGDNLQNIDSIKKMIMTYGAVATCMCYDDSFIDNDYNHYQPSYSNLLPNHSIAIVGWDDNHNVPAATHQGAWLCKNSWGSSWGYNGYFWISYYDKWACREPFMGAVSFIHTEPLQYELVYYHDYHGWRDTKTDTKKIFNKFHSREDIWLNAVSFFTAKDEVNFQIKIFGTFDGENLGYLLSEQSGFILHRGFHTIDLDLPVKLHNDDDFYIYLYLSDGGQPYDRTSTIDVLMGDTTLKKGLKEAVTVRSAANPDESYYLENGIWKDFYNYQDPSGYLHSGNFCVKGLAKNSNPQKLGAVIHIFKDMNPLQGALVVFGDDTAYTDTTGAALFKDYNPYTEDIPLSVKFEDIEENYTYSITDTVLIVDLYYSTAGIQTLNNIAVFPNPATDYFVIKNLIPNSVVEIFDIDGRLLYSKRTISDEQNINISSWQPGIYLMKINGMIVPEKIVKR